MVNIPNNEECTEWQQYEVVHCPDKKCKGMLLQNPYFYHELCSDCGKKWNPVTKYQEVV